MDYGVVSLNSDFVRGPAIGYDVRRRSGHMGNEEPYSTKNERLI